MMPRYAEVALHLARVQGTFHYHIPDELLPILTPGHLVVVPFGRRRAQGVVLNLTEESPVPETRPIEGLVESQPALTPAQLGLAAWMHQATLAPIGECASMMIPAGLTQHADQEYRLVDHAFPSDGDTQGQLVKLLRAHGPLRGRQIERRLGRRDWRRAANGLARRGILESTPVLDEPRVSPRRLRTVRLAIPPAQAQLALGDLGRGQAAERRRNALLAVLEEASPLEVTWLYAEAGARAEDLRDLERRGLVAFDAREVLRDPLADAVVEQAAPPVLTRDQQAAWEPIHQAIDSGVAAAFLLHGVTGSGKTEIYLRAVAQVLETGGSAIVLVPEISLTPQTTDRFLARFPGRVGLLHSALAPGERYDTWRRARSGALPLVVGPRSALFAPLPAVRLIVVDEEHDESYKEREGPARYHAREAALAYARLLGAVCLLGSATPDVVTFHRAEAGEIRLLRLPRRILGQRQALEAQHLRHRLPLAYQPLEGDAVAIDLPPVHVVDMRQELRAGNASLFSRSLERALAATLASGQQAILFLNRRGAATHVFCRDCGWVARCPRCDTALIHHPAGQVLRCHHCGYRRLPPRRCPECAGTRVRYFGAGTQRIQAEVERRHPGVRTLRWDWDVTRRKGAHAVILAHFAAHRADVLVGTQMIAKGLDLPLVTLVGVVSADTGLHLPDYRAAERVFQVLTQVAGRAGRGPAGGQVILQTYHPDHAAILAASAHDYQAFYQTELHHRRELGYPPFRQLVRLVVRAGSSERAEQEARRLASRLRSEVERRGEPVEVVGPTPCFFPHLRGRWRWQILLRGSDPSAAVPQELPEGWSVDVDPVNLL